MSDDINEVEVDGSSTPITDGPVADYNDSNIGPRTGDVSPNGILSMIPVEFSNVSLKFKEFESSTGDGDYNEVLRTGLTNARRNLKHGAQETFKSDVLWGNGINLVDRDTRGKFASKSTDLGKSTASTIFAQTSGMGLKGRFDLLNSGVSMRINKFSDLTMMAIHQEFVTAQEDMAIDLFGIAPHATNVHAIRMILEAMSPHILHINLKVDTILDAFDHILITDVNPMITAWLAVTYPRGYPINLFCIEDINKCNHVDQVNIMFDKTIKHNDSKLDDAAREYINDWRNDHTIEDQKAYIERIVPTKNIPLKDLGSTSEGFVTLQIPTVNQFLTESELWINGLEARVLEQFKTNISKETRMHYITQLRAVTWLRQYSPYVKSITYIDEDGDGEEYVKTDRAEIFDFLDELSGSDTDINIFGGILVNYINSSKVTAVGHMREACSNCGAVPSKTDVFNGEIIEMDVLKDFFTINHWRAEHRLSRVFKGIS